MKTVTEFNTAVIVVTKMITYKFRGGVLHKMHERSHLAMMFFIWRMAILALANFDSFSLVPVKVTGWKVKNCFGINFIKENYVNF